jgi:hypothetical protein
MRAAFRVGWTCVTLAALLLLQWACSGDGDDPTDPGQPQTIRVELIGTPELSFNPDNGTTNVVVQFIARDENSVPLTEDDVEVELQLDGKAIDTEAILERDSEELASNIHLTMVLDASYSMLRHEPPAFQPMLKSARRTIQEGRNVYLDRPGEFDWSMFWFNDLIYEPTEPWPDFVIESLPEPTPGTFTKLFAAVRRAVEDTNRRAAASTKSREHFILVVFSDGADNYSWFANPEVAGSSTIANDYTYDYQGSNPVTKEDALAAIRDHPDLQVHVAGLGSSVNDKELSELATAGHGRYFKNLDPSQVSTLFDQVIREFTTMQTQGVTLPVPPGNYRFKIVVHRPETKGTASLQFDFHGGDGNAGVRD